MSYGHNNTTFNESSANYNIKGNAVRATEQFKHVCCVLWLCGIAVSCVGLMVQLGLFYRVPRSRKHDEKILTLLSSTRIMNTICEYIIVTNISGGILKEFLFLFYVQSDFMMVCWMFVFSKNLYDKVVLVFTFRKYNLFTIFIIIFFLSLPLGILCPILLNQSEQYFNTFYHIYSAIKFCIIVINALIFIRIFSIAHARGSSTTRNVAHVIKAAVMSFILVCITSLQVFVTDVISLVIGLNEYIIYVSCVLNSLQVVLITAIFVTLARGKQRRADSRSTVVTIQEAQDREVRMLTNI